MARKNQAQSRDISISSSEVAAFDEVVKLITDARQRAYQTVNATLVDLCWQVGKYMSEKLEAAVWGEGVVEALALHIQKQHPIFKGLLAVISFE